MRTLRRILVVEDDMTVARDILQQLTELSYEPVGHTMHGDQAIRMAGELQPDLVLMNARLAGDMDGITAAQAIRARYDMPVVILSAYATDDTLVCAKLEVPFGGIVQPFTDRGLRTALEIALHSHAAKMRLQYRTRQLTALSQRAIDLQEAHRSQMALELHEKLGQALTAIKINLQLPAAGHHGSVAERDQDTLRIVEDSLQWVRQMALGLRPSMLDDFGLVSSLWWLGEKTAEQHALQIRFRVPAPLPRAQARIETACFRIVEQVCANLVPHSRASRIHVYLYLHNGFLVMGLRDNGIGLAAESDDPCTLDLLGLQERAAQVGGQLEIRSRPGHGVSVRMRCPWPSPTPGAAAG